MKILRSTADFDAFYFYQSKPQHHEYPSNYPCIAEKVTRGGGLAGEYVAHEFIYIPPDVDEASFVKGVEAVRGKYEHED